MYAVTGAKVHTAGKAGSIDGATILVEDGRILDVGKGVNVPEGCTVHDVTGLQISPGFIDAHSHAGFANGTLSVADACDLSTPLSPELLAVDAFCPTEPALARSLAGGVTTIGLMPGNFMTIGGIVEPISVIPGVGAAIKTRTQDQMPVVLRKRAAMKMAVGEHPKKTMKDSKKAPATRMGLMALLREVLDYGKDEKPGRKYENAASLLRREFPARVHAHRVRDMLPMVELSKEYGFDLVFDHATEGYMMADVLRENNIPCVVGPIVMVKMGPELQNLRLDNAVTLVRAGVKVAITCDHPSFPGWYLPMHAGLLAREGMDYQDALKTVTLNAAEILGVSERVGSIEKGKDADFVVFDGDPLEYASPIQAVVSDGEVVRGCIGRVIEGDDCCDARDGHGTGCGRCDSC